MYLLDTCVYSEFAKPRPSPKVLAWANSVRETDQYLSVLVLGELLKGIGKMPEGDRKHNLELWIEGLFDTHHDRLIPVDAAVIRIWAGICADAETSGRTAPAMDSLIVAQVRSRGLTLVTRNAEVFRQLGVKLLNPWD